MVNEYGSISLIRLQQRDRSFAAKVQGFNAGFSELGDLHFDIISNVSADISFGADCFASLFRQFDLNPNSLGTPLEAGLHYGLSFCSTFDACRMPGSSRRIFRQDWGCVPIAGGGDRLDRSHDRPSDDGVGDTHVYQKDLSA